MEHAERSSSPPSGPPPDPLSDLPPRRLLSVAALLTAVAAAGVLYSVDASNGHNALDLPAQDVRLTVALAPQGWGFFTRNPQGAGTYLLRREVDGWSPAGPGRNAEPSNLFGFRRVPRARGVEMGRLVQALGSDAWQECKDLPGTCVDGLPVSAVIPNDNPVPLYCGELAVVRQEPVPWAWSSASAPVVMPSFVARIEVQC